LTRLNVYIACALAQAHHARDYATRLGMFESYQVVSAWHDLVTEKVDPTDAGTRREVLLNNLADLSRAHVVLALMDKGTPRATIGEAVWALAHSKPVVWLCGGDGTGRNVWDAHALVTLCDRHEQVLPALHRISMEMNESPSATRMRLPSSPPSDASGAFRAAAECLTRKAGAR
jgi:hypothetical protein